MNIAKKTAALIAGLLAATMMGQAVAAYTFPDDVPASHWAYASIDKVTNMGIMSGITVTEFDINGMLSMFDTARILARLGGYDASSTNQEDATFYQYCYDKHFPLIQQFSANLSRWQHDYDKEIAFLLELGVFIDLDLEGFVVIMDGAERYYALSRAQICVFFARLLQADDVAHSFVPTDLFTDDGNIDSSLKPYVYYMRHIGIVSGSDGYFYPKESVNRAAMAVMADKMLALVTPVSGSNYNGGNTQGSATYGTFSGRIVQVHASFKAVEIQNLVSGEKKLFPVLNNAAIAINGQANSFSGLQAGMDAAAVLLNNEISDIVAVSASGGQQGQAVTQNPSGGSIPNLNYIDSSLLELAVIEGTVKSVRTVGSDHYLDVLVKLINSKSEVYTETRTFIIDPNCPITRGVVNTDYTDITEGDMVKLTIAGSTAYTVYLEEKYRNIVGTVLSKRAVESTGMGVIAVKDANDRTHELVTTAETIVTRTGFPGIPKWSDIKVGDTAEISAEYDKIISIGATGSRNFADVTITKIHIEEGFSEITAVDALGVEKAYPIVPGVDVDPYSLRIGYQVRLGLDSQEVENVLVLSGGPAEVMTGHIRHITSSGLAIQDSMTQSYRTVSYDSNTVVINGNTGLRMTLGDLRTGMSVRAVYSTVNSVPHITEITVLAP
ncbi:MAG: S-layer homology domain-containing protein [Clostridiales bacterium]|jgi:hypothetical protein|nr:S-layer homology domain-containing protein [Clostridiales bacterium]